MAMDEKYIEVLFEYKGSKKILYLPPSKACERVQEEMRCIGYSDAVVTLSVMPGPTDCFYLQRWCEKYKTFVDIESCEDQIVDNDRLSVTRSPMYSETSIEVVKKSEGGSSKIKSILDKVSKPTEAEASALASLFPGQKPMKPFNPRSPCVASANMKKKKAAIKPINKDSHVSVMMMKEFSPKLPKGAARLEMIAEGRLQSVRIGRLMTPEEVKAKLCEAFSVTDYTVLHCDGVSKYLMKCNDQNIDGIAAIERRGCLYLCESMQQRTSSLQKGQKRSNEASEEAELDLPPSSVLKKYKGDPKKSPVITVESGSSSDDEAKAQNWQIYLSQEIRRIQDEEYEKSLNADIEKDRAEEIKAIQQLKIDEAQQQLCDKWSNQMNVQGGKTFHIRLPNSERIECSLPFEASAMALYEITVGLGKVVEPFLLYTAVPSIQKRCVKFDEPIQNIDLNMLVAEENDNGFDLLTLLPALRVPVAQENDPADGNQNYNFSVDEEGVLPLIKEVDTLREKYMFDDEDMDTHLGTPRYIHRDEIYEDVVAMYRNKFSEIVKEFPFRIKYIDERAVDTGGVARDMFSGFWEKCYLYHCDGEKLLVPAVHPNTDMAAFSVLGTILVHGFMTSGFMPVKLAFPVVAYVLCGPEMIICDSIFLESLVDYVPTSDCNILKKAFKVTDDCYDEKMKTGLIDILSRLGCSEMPTPSNIKRLLISTAKHTFHGKPLGLLITMRAGVPACYHKFWQQFDIDKLFSIYKALNASVSSVLKSIMEPIAMNAAEDKVFKFLRTYITNLKVEELRRFLRFVTGSSVLTSMNITIIFNNLSGAGRRPLVHTCDCTLELSKSYSSYPEFEHEFTVYLLDETSWIMDSD